jgi:hypothetical protein
MHELHCLQVLLLWTEITLPFFGLILPTGKTTMVKKLTNKLNGQKMSTPPPCLQPLRSHFDDQPIVLRRAYYGLGNYIAAREVERQIQFCPIIMDRLVPAAYL